MTAATLTITDFLLARIAETEHMLLPLVDEVECLGEHFVNARDLVRADCEAKRRIVETADPDHGLGRVAVRALAAIYSDHPDYREEWRP